ncbi:hypothetical protein L2E82_28643 [Cichorium intybus]|uniref:Uncharacterized protein n=1 Tax=Cichorium intybus TaxID=13427 RepID=A0ACB9CWK1_CICIN|nr:hypothetical protein L2E82_28643 [Cichorium intybus]
MYSKGSWNLRINLKEELLWEEKVLVPMHLTEEEEGLRIPGSKFNHLFAVFSEERCVEVESLVFDLFANLGATDEYHVNWFL